MSNRIITGKHSELNKVVAYTDGACRKQPTESGGPGGYGVVLLYTKHEQELSEGFRLTNSPRMEMWAAIAALQARNPQKCAVTICSDSKFLVDSISQGWVYRWKENGWKKKNKEIPNADLWMRLLKLCEQHEVKFVHVKGHDGNPYHERADQLAKEALDRENLLIDTIYEEDKVQMTQPTLF